LEINLHAVKRNIFAIPLTRPSPRRPRLFIPEHSLRTTSGRVENKRKKKERENEREREREREGKEKRERGRQRGKSKGDRYFRTTFSLNAMRF